MILFEEVVRWSGSFRSCCSPCSSCCRAPWPLPRHVVHMSNGGQRW